MEQIRMSREHITLDLLLFRRFGAAGQFLLESVLDANRGLAAKGPVLPVGTIVTLPEQLGRTSTGERPVVDLFG